MARRPTPQPAASARKSAGRPAAQRAERRKADRRKPRRRWPKVLAALVLLGLGTLAYLVWPFWHLAGQFATYPTKQPSRLYGRVPVLRQGDRMIPEELAGRLEEAGYRRFEREELRPGTYRLGGRSIEVFRRRFPTPDGPTGGDRLEATFGNGRIETLAVGGRRVARAVLDPPLVASFYGPDLRERRPVGLDELPEDLVLAVLAIEDSEFLDHKGVSLRGIARAAWANLRRGEVTQGGSTLTQQLVKNLYLTHERSWLRKLREALLAVLIEIRYDKRAVIRAYLNEIFWGRSGSVNLMGVGAAAWAYFDKQPAQLTLAESALLAGMIQSPSSYSPLSHPDRARERRDVVLARLAELRWVERERLEAAAREPIRAADGPWIARQAPYFADAMAEEARARFGAGELRDTGYVLHSTLDLRDQRKAEEAVSWGVQALEDGWEKERKTSSPLQAALISIDPRDGAILVYVGGRDYGASQFDRVALARRQPGSAFKPVVYAAAFADRVATPASMLDDSAYTVTYEGRTWSPQNSDGKYSGPVSVRAALERSLNVPTARLALEVGLKPIVRLARQMGIDSEIEPFPALALGTMEVTPREMATVYGTLASGGLRPPVHGLEAVYDRGGQRVPGLPLPEATRVLDEKVVYLVTSILQGVLDRGTGKGARAQGLDDRLAGKTGTTNSRRDSWFAGYSSDRATLVWVGYDDNSRTQLSGSRAALPIWTRFVDRVRPRDGFPDFQLPEGILLARIDPHTGGLATTRCDDVVTEVFLADFAPRHLCPDHSGLWARPLDQPEGIEPEKPHRFRRWLQMMRGDRP